MPETNAPALIVPRRGLGGNEEEGSHAASAVASGSRNISAFAGWALREISAGGLRAGRLRAAAADEEGPTVLLARPGLLRRFTLGILEDQPFIGAQPDDLAAIAEIDWAGIELRRWPVIAASGEERALIAFVAGAQRIWLPGAASAVTGASGEGPRALGSARLDQARLDQARLDQARLDQEGLLGAFELRFPVFPASLLSASPWARPREVALLEIEVDRTGKASLTARSQLSLPARSRMFRAAKTAAPDGPEGRPSDRARKAAAGRAAPGAAL